MRLNGQQLAAYLLIDAQTLCKPSQSVLCGHAGGSHRLADGAEHA
jgi:hypothetical protein